MYVFVTCNFFIITGPLLESTRLDGPDDQETLPYQQQDNDDQRPSPTANDDQPTMPYQEDDDQPTMPYQEDQQDDATLQEDQQDDATLPHFDVPPQLQESSLQDPPPVNAVAAPADITYHFTTSQRGADQLVDSVGYSYNTKWKNQRGDRHWQCVVRTKTLKCAAGMCKKYYDKIYELCKR